VRIDYLLRSGWPIFSFEFLAPRSPAETERLFRAARDLSGLEPSFVCVTCRAGRHDETLAMSRQIRSDTGMETMAHLVCEGLDNRDVTAFLDPLRSDDVVNVLALRGDRDPATPLSGSLRHASDLIGIIAETGGFCVGAACYPEGHVESPSLAADLRHARRKVDLGATFLITQLFFDNNHYFRFVAAARAEGIEVPILPGIMPITNAKQLPRVRAIGASVPEQLERDILLRGDDPEAVAQFGVAWASDLGPSPSRRRHVEYTVERRLMSRRVSFIIAALVVAATLVSPTGAFAQAGNWERMPGAATAIASGGGAVWCIGTDRASGAGNHIYRWQGGSWTRYPGAAVRIAVDSNGQPWVVNAQHQIFRLSGQSQWQHLPGLAVEIAAGGGAVWVLGTNAMHGGYGVWRWDSGQWTSVPGAGVKIAVDGRGIPWVVNRQHEIYSYKPAMQTWRRLPGAATNIGANPGVWVTGIDAVSGGYEIFRWDERNWQKYPGGAVSIVVGPGGRPWVVNDSNTIFRLNQ
jgi:methylenetetrahydrofolate reductase (NADPH)